MDYFTMPTNPIGQLIVVLGIIFVVFFIVLLILLPFYVQSINTWTRTSAKELEIIREILMLMRKEKNRSVATESKTPESNRIEIMRD